MSTLQRIVEKSIDRVESLIETASCGKEIEQCLSALERLESFCELRGASLDLDGDSHKEDVEKAVGLIALAGIVEQMADAIKAAYEATASWEPKAVPKTLRETLHECLEALQMALVVEDDEVKLVPVEPPVEVVQAFQRGDHSIIVTWEGVASGKAEAKDTIIRRATSRLPF